MVIVVKGASHPIHLENLCDNDMKKSSAADESQIVPESQ